MPAETLLRQEQFTKYAIKLFTCIDKLNLSPLV